MDEDSHRIRVTVGHDAHSAPPLSRKALESMRPALTHAQSMVKPLTPDTEADPEPPAAEVPDTEEHKDAPEDTDTTDTRDQPEPSSDEPNKVQRLLKYYWRHKLWTLPLTVLVVLLAVFAVPMSRYKILAFFISKPFSVTVTDSTTGTPVSGATVKLDGQTTTTDSKGRASITSPVGNQTLSISKTYYKSDTEAVFVDISGTNSLGVKLVATGRQVPVKVVNAITGQAIPEVVLTFSGTNAKTDLNGLATVVLPTTAPTQAATLTVDGYNDLSANVQVTTQVVAANTFAMVPKGRIYFLSDLSGKVDVVSTNLDGSGRKTVLEGTGTEDKNNTVLLASRDWSYLALLSKRDGGDHAKLFLINTANGQLSTVDNSAADFTLVGWYNHYFTYEATQANADPAPAGNNVVKSYNADTSTAATLATSQAVASASGNQSQDFSNFNYIGSNLVYTVIWYTAPGTVVSPGQQDALMSVKIDGTGSRTLKSVDAGTSYIDPVVLAAPNQIYFEVSGGGGSNNYYRLDSNENITQSSTITANDVNQSYPTYLISPSAQYTFWTTVRDGKNVLFVGDSNGNNGNQIASLSDYTPYGWYTDNYLLVEKSHSELYIMPVGGGTPRKVSDYFKPDYYIYGYGGGYGGF